MNTKRIPIDFPDDKVIGAIVSTGRLEEMSS